MPRLRDTPRAPGCVESADTLHLHSAKTVNDMSEQALRDQDRRAFWYIVAICLVPLVPYALRGAGA